MKNKLKKICALGIFFNLMNCGFFIQANNVVVSSVRKSSVLTFSHKIQLLAFNFKTEIVVLIISLLIAGLVMMVLKSGMNTAKKATRAKEYLVKDSFKLKISKDIYLYSDVVSTPKPKQQSNTKK